MPNSAGRTRKSGGGAAAVPSNERKSDNYVVTYLASNAFGMGTLSSMVYVLSLSCMMEMQKRHDFCHATPPAAWTMNASVFLIGASFFSVFVQLVRFITESAAHHINSSSAAWLLLSISFMMFLSQVLCIVEGFDFVCSDVLGLRTPLVMWAEWSTSVPAMMFLSVTLDPNKSKLTIEDFQIVIGSFLAIMLTFMLTWGITATQSLVVVLCATIVLSRSLLLLYRQSIRNMMQLIRSTSEQMSSLRHIQMLELRIAGGKLRSTIFLCCTFPLFPLNFFLGWIGLIDKDVCFVVTLCLNFLVKHAFSLYAVDQHLEMLDPNLQVIATQSAANESRRAFLRYVFHEVRVPLNSISMGLHVLLMNENMSEEDKETIGMMREAAGFMAETLNDVLSIQKIEEGKLELQFARCLIASIVRTVHMSLLGQLNSKSINLSIEIGPDVPPCIVADRFRLEHVLANLVSNAIKFSPKDSKVQIVVRREEGSTTGGATPKTISLRWSVLDQGVGVSAEDQKGLFVAYSQIRPSELQQGRGTGVGLAICKDIIQHHGGYIGVNSSPENGNKGSEFYFVVPFEVSEVQEGEDFGDALHDSFLSAEESKNNAPSSNESRSKVIAGDGYNDILNQAAMANAVHQKSATASSNVAVSSSSYSPSSSSLSAAAGSLDNPVSSATSKGTEPQDVLVALVVDDVNSNRKLLSMLLTKKGIVCESAGDGSEAVEVIKSNVNKFNMVFMDNMMPNMNGVEATKILRKLEFPGLIIGLTGNALDEDLMEFVVAGADIALPKPFQMKHLDKLLLHCRKFGTESVQSDLIEQNKGLPESPKQLSLKQIQAGDK